MYYLISISILLLIGFIYINFETTLVKVEKVRFTKDARHLKILHISDIHIHRLRVPVLKVQKALEIEKPDLVIMSGDYIEKPKDLPKFIAFLNKIKGKHKIYMTLGNHDYKTFRNNDAELTHYMKEIEKTGAIILDNTSACFEKNSKKYNIIGIQDIRYFRHDIKKAFSFCAQDASINIAISHNPDVALQIPEGKVDYLFCGHFHGGQIWMPFHLEFKLLRHDKLPKKGITRGLHRINGIHLYINRGLGNVCFPFRLFSRPEITIYHIP